MFVYYNEVFSYPDAKSSSIQNDHKNHITINNIKRRVLNLLSQFSFKKKDNCAH